jgi:hypothetical protein
MISTRRRRRPRLEAVGRRLDRWRQTRRHARAPLPPRFWAAAVALVPEHGLYGTARALHLDYGTLKRHVEGRGAPVRPSAPPGFVELAPPPPPARDTWLIEIEGVRATVRVRLTGLALTDLADFTRRVVGAGA